jgi:type I restriction enzyme M protein
MRDRVDVILTNPPFGGEEERGILANFPSDKQTAETALLFLQLIMRKIRRAPKPGRAAVVAPNGTLFGDGVCGRIKEELLKEFNLHTIVRLPKGVFAPYTPIPTNILFFDHSGPTQDVWYFEQPLPEGKKNYTKTAPVQFEEFGECIKWWNKREQNERAWKWNFRADHDEAVAKAKPHWQEAERQRNSTAKFNQQAKKVGAEIDDLRRRKTSADDQHAQKLASERERLLIEAKRADEQARQEQAKGDAIYWPIYNLDRKNPSAKQDITHLPPDQLADSILQKEQRIAEIMGNIRKLLAKQ